MSSLDSEIGLLLIFGTLGSLILVIGVGFTVYWSQKRIVQTHRERLAEVEKRERENALLLEEVTDLKNRLEQRVLDRTRELTARTEELNSTIQALKETQAQLVLSEKMASLGKLVGGLAHEMNNPLAVVSGSLGFVGEYFKKLEQFLITSRIELSPALAMSFQDAAALLQGTQTAANRMRNLVQNLKRFAHLEEAELQAVDIHIDLETTIDLFVLQPYPGIAVEKKFGPLPKVTCYAAELNQVFMHLLMNSSHAIEDRLKRDNSAKGLIQVETSCPKPDWVRIVFKDNGAGLSPDVAAHMFDPFFTTKEIGRGRGLGLSICYSIVQRHSGTLTYEPGSDGMTGFIVDIPRTQESREFIRFEDRDAEPKH